MFKVLAAAVAAATMLISADAATLKDKISQGAVLAQTEAELVPSTTTWGKQDYINAYEGRFRQADSQSAGSYNYNKLWKSIVDAGVTLDYCPPGKFWTGTPTGYKSDYVNQVWGCFAKGDSAASGSYDYKSAWNGAVNNCLATYCTQY